MVVQDGLSTTDPNCPKAVSDGFEALQKMSLTESGRDKISTMFKLLNKL